MNSYQNCNNVIENFHSIYLYRSDEIFIQEKINKGPNFISFYIKEVDWSLCSLIIFNIIYIIKSMR